MNRDANNPRGTVRDPLETTSHLPRRAKTISVGVHPENVSLTEANCKGPKKPSTRRMGRKEGLSADKTEEEK